jgi:hypothetical protein
MRMGRGKYDDLKSEARYGSDHRCADDHRERDAISALLLEPAARAKQFAGK